MGNGGDDHLGDSVAVIDGVGLGAQVNERDEHLASVVGINRARRVGECNAKLGREPRARSDLAFVSNRDGASKAKGDLHDLHGFERDRLGHVVARQTGGQVKPGGVCRFVLREDRSFIESFDAEDGGVDASAAGEFDLGVVVSGACEGRHGGFGAHA